MGVDHRPAHRIAARDRGRRALATRQPVGRWRHGGGMTAPVRGSLGQLWMLAQRWELRLVDHARQGLGDRREELIHYVERGLVEAELKRGQRDPEIRRGPGLEQARLAVVVDEVLLHPPQEVDRSGRSADSVMLGSSPGSG